MTIFLLTFAILLTAVAGMAIGVVVAGKRLKGSCGGTESSCECLRQGIEPRCENAPTGHPRLPVSQPKPGPR